MSRLKNKVIFLTGGTGSFGSAFVPMTLNKLKPKKLIIYSRDESKQWDMRNLYSKNKNIKKTCLVSDQQLTTESYPKIILLNQQVETKNEGIFSALTHFENG